MKEFTLRLIVLLAMFAGNLNTAIASETSYATIEITSKIPTGQNFYCSGEYYAEVTSKNGITTICRGSYTFASRVGGNTTIVVDIFSDALIFDTGNSWMKGFQEEISKRLPDTTKIYIELTVK